MPTPPPEAAYRLAAIVESSDDAIVSKDLNGIITSWNKGAEELFGYTAADAVGRSIRIVIPQDRQGEEDVVLARIRAGERVDHFDTVRQRKDGTLVDISLTVSPIRDASGKVIGASKIARNISERKRIEAQLYESRHRMTTFAMASANIVRSPSVDAVTQSAIALARDVFASDGYAIWRSTPAGEWRIVRSFGLSPSFTARSIAPKLGDEHPAIVPFAEPLICEDVDAASPLGDLRDAYKREGIGSLIVFPLLIHGERTGTLVFYSHLPRRYQPTDVQVGIAAANLAAAALTSAELYEEQRRAREAADHARQQGAFLAEASRMLSASLDYEATLQRVAQLAVPTIADWCAVDVVMDGNGIKRLATAHVDAEKVALAREIEERYPADPTSPGGVHQVLRTGEAVMMTHIPPERLRASAQDADHWRLLQALSLTSYMCVPLTAQGKTFGVITFVSAESQREYQEDDLRFAKELAARCSLAVENARAYARANEASRLKDEFLATLSHELRTPLNAVMGYVKLLKLGGVPADKMSHAIEVIDRNALSLKQIIEDVLDISRIVAGRLRLNVSPVDLALILREAVATVAPAAEAKQVRIETILDSPPPIVSGDADRLQQVVWNLLSNAIKFTPKSGRVQLRLARVNSHVEITVSDTGAGIAPDFLPLVFDRFRQADQQFSREHGGLGLGLSIARQLTEMHGGTITAASDGPGLGSTFTVRLPLMIVHSNGGPTTPPETLPVSGAVTSDHGQHRLDGVSLLVVDDEPDALSLMKTVLEGAGARVTIAESGPAALELLRRARVDALIADIGMPGMDGLQFIREVRLLNGPARAVPAAALTAYARSQDRITTLSSGFQMHLVKPIDPTELIVAVAALAKHS